MILARAWLAEVSAQTAKAMSVKNICSFLSPGPVEWCMKTKGTKIRGAYGRILCFLSSRYEKTSMPANRSI